MRFTRSFNIATNITNISTNLISRIQNNSWKFSGVKKTRIRYILRFSQPTNHPQIHCLWNFVCLHRRAGYIWRATFLTHASNDGKPVTAAKVFREVVTFSGFNCYTIYIVLYTATIVDCIISWATLINQNVLLKVHMCKHIW